MEAYRRQYNNKNIRTSYIDGNAARKLSAVPDIRREEPAKRQPEHIRQPQRQPRAMHGISFASLLVLTAASIATVYVCIEYLKLQYEVNTMDKNIISMEKELTAVTHENDAAYEAINTAFDLDYVYHVAVEELGMVYPQNNTVITYKSSGTDYVRQYEDME
jgi:cell division protein FtsL